METPDNSGLGNMNYASINDGNNGLNSIVSKQDVETTEVLKISGKYNSVIIAKNLVMDINEFNRLNPAFDLEISSGEGFDLRLPSEKMDVFVGNKYSILNECVHLLLNTINTDTKTVYPTQKSYKKKK